MAEETKTTTVEDSAPESEATDATSEASGSADSKNGGNEGSADMSGQQSLGDEISNSAKDTGQKFKNAAKNDMNRLKNHFGGNQNGGNKSGDNAAKGGSAEKAAEGAGKAAEGASKAAESAGKAASGAADAATGGAAGAVGGALSKVAGAIKNCDTKASDAIKNAKNNSKGNGGNGGTDMSGKQSMGDEISGTIEGAMKAAAAIAVTAATAGAGAAVVGGGAASKGGVDAAKAIAKQAGKAAAKAATNADVGGSEEMNFGELLIMLIIGFLAIIQFAIVGVFVLIVAAFKQVWDFIVSLFTDDNEDEVDWATYMPNDEYVKLSDAIDKHINEAYKEMEKLWDEDKDSDRDKPVTVWDGDTEMYFENIFGEAIDNYNEGKSEADKYTVDSWAYIGNGHSIMRHAQYSNWYFPNRESYSESIGTNHYYPDGLQGCEGYEGYFDSDRSENEFSDHSDEGKVADMCYVISGYNASKREKPITDSDNWFAATFHSYKWDIDGMVWDQSVDSEGLLTATGKAVARFFEKLGEKFGLGDGPAPLYFHYEVVRMYDANYPRKYRIKIEDTLVDKPVSKTYQCEETSTTKVYQTTYKEARYNITLPESEVNATYGYVMYSSDGNSGSASYGFFSQEYASHLVDVYRKATNTTDIYYFTGKTRDGQTIYIVGMKAGTYTVPASMLSEFQWHFAEDSSLTELSSYAETNGPTEISSTTSTTTHTSAPTTSCADEIQAMIEAYYAQGFSIDIGNTVINEDGVSLETPIENTPERNGCMSYANASVPFSTAKAAELEALISSATASPSKMSKADYTTPTNRTKLGEVSTEGYTDDANLDWIEEYSKTTYSFTDWEEISSVNITFESSHYITVNCKTLYWYLKASTSPFDSDLFLATLFEQSKEYISDEEREHIDYNDDYHAYTKDVDDVKRTTYMMPNFSRNEADTEITSENYGEIKLTCYQDTTAANLNEMEADFVVGTGDGAKTYDYWLLCWFEENGIKEQPYYGSVTLFQYTCGCLGTATTCVDSEKDIYHTADGTDPRNGTIIVDGWTNERDNVPDHDSSEGCGAAKVESDGEGTNGYISEKQINGKDVACKTQTAYLLDENGEPFIDPETGEKVSIGTTYMRVIDKITSGSEELYHTCISTHDDTVGNYYGTYNYNLFGSQSVGGVSLNNILTLTCQLSEYFGDLKEDDYRSISCFDSNHTTSNTRFANVSGKTVVKLGKLQLTGNDLKKYLEAVRNKCMNEYSPTSAEYRTFIDIWDTFAGSTVGMNDPYFLGKYSNVVEGTYDQRYSTLPDQTSSYSGIWTGTTTPATTKKCNAFMDAITNLMKTDVGVEVMEETIANKAKENISYIKTLGFTDPGAILVLADMASEYGLNYLKTGKGKDVIAKLTPSTATAQTVAAAYASVDGSSSSRRNKIVEYVTEMTEANNWVISATSEHASSGVSYDSESGTIDGEAYPDNDYDGNGTPDWRDFYNNEDYYSFNQDPDKASE